MCCFFRLKRVIGDEVATKCFFDTKGFSGIKCCAIACKNVVNIRREQDGGSSSLAEHQEGNYLVSIACADPARFDPMSDQDVWDSHDALDALARTPGVRKGAINTLQVEMGFSWNEWGVLADRELREHVLPKSCLLRDAMHVLVANGVMNVELGLLFTAISKCTPGFGFHVVQELASADWHWCPGGLSRAAFADIFNDHRRDAWHSTGVFKAGASEVLQAYPFIRWFVLEQVPSNKVPLERSSFLSLCVVMDLVDKAKHALNPRAVRDDLVDAVGRFQRAHQLAYGIDSVIPKHHYMWHVAQEQEDDLFLDCFVHERKNKIVKQAIQHIENTEIFETSAIKMLMVKVLPLMDNFVLDNLIEPVARSPTLEAAFGCMSVVSKSMRWRGSVWRAGAVILIDGAAMEVHGCARIGTEVGVLVSKFVFVDTCGTHSTWRRRVGATDLVRPEGSHRCAGWFEAENGNIVVLH